MQFEPVPLDERHDEWRSRVRRLVADSLPSGRRPVLGMTGGHEPAFSAALGAAGLAGLAIPVEDGGGGCTSVERFVVTEELLAAGAPITAHWGADRQIGPNLVAFGTPEQRRTLMPRIVRGELCFSLGMSEPDAGSDLASVRTAATRTEGGWLVNGTKVWTSYADRNDYFMVLCRTSREDDRHRGLSQLMVDLRAPGVEVRAIECLDPHHHFHEVVMTDAFVPDQMVLGEIGHGWQQVTAELTLERAGPDRFMSAYPLLAAYVEATDAPRERDAHVIGGLVARLWVIRHLSLSTSGSLDRGRNPAVEAALVKDLGSSHEQEIVEALRRLRGEPLDLASDDQFESLLAEAVLAAPSYTIRGGTVEILRSVASKGLRVVGGGSAAGDVMLQDTVERLLRDRLGPPQGRGSAETWMPSLWAELEAIGVPWLGVSEGAGGSGGSAGDVEAVVRLAAFHAAPGPIAESIAGASLLAAADRPMLDGVVTTASSPLRLDEASGRVVGELRRVPWGADAHHVVAVAIGAADGAAFVGVLRGTDLAWTRGHNLAGEPRDDASVDVVIDDGWVRLPGTTDGDVARDVIGRLTAVKLGGACQAATDVAVQYAGDRHQFGQPIRRFQAVQHHLVHAAAETALATMGGSLAMACPTPFAVAAARTVAARAAREVAAAAHQVHGAIGMTVEYPLHLWTRRLWSWADESGSEDDWAQSVGRRVLAGGATDLWGAMTSGPSSSPSSSAFAF